MAAATPAQRSLALLERLPNELLQRIFFECLEFNLPRASPRLAAALSIDVAYTWLIRLAFSSSNTSSETGLFVHPYLPLDYFALDTRERATLQTEILSCNWCTTAFVRKCQREYVQHVLNKKCADLIMPEESAARLRNLEREWTTANWREQVPHGRRGKGDLLIAAQERSTGKQVKIAIWYNYGALQIREPSPVVDNETDVFRLPCGNFPEPCRMPDRLLRPPWTDDKYELFTLFSTEAYIDEDNSFERSKAVLRQLILDRDFTTFERLLSTQIRVKVYAYPLRWPVRPNHFRLAARYAEGDDDPFLDYLFTHRRDEIPRDDPSIRTLTLRYDRGRA